MTLRPTLSIAAALIAVAISSPTVTGAPRTIGDIEIFPLQDVRPGMKGVGLTVFEGDEVEEFEVEILGIMENALSPKRDIIFVELVGEKVEYTGVAAGMSGSPVYVDGKLLGSLSYRFGSFSKEPLGGVTPIEYMLELEEGPGGPGSAGAVPGGVPLSESVARRPIRWSEAFQSFVMNRRKTPFDAAAVLAVPRGPASTLAPIGAALNLGGFGPESWGAASQLFGSLGFAPVQGAAVSLTGATGSDQTEGPALRPGSAVAVQLVRGDMDVTATGTVTLVDGGRVYAFGHQFFNFGGVSFPMARASIIRTLASPAGSFKVAALGAPTGSITQDRMAGVFGWLDKPAEMVPVEIEFVDGSGEPMTYDYEIAADPALAPLLLQFTLQNVFQAADKTFGPKTLHLTGTIEVDGEPAVEVKNLFAGQTAYAFASSYVAAFLSFIYSNEFALPTVSGVKLRIDATDEVKMASLTGVVPSAYAARPGETIRLRVDLQPRRGDATSVDYELEIPKGAAPGAAWVYVGDALNLNRLQGEGTSWEPHSMGEVIDLLNGLRRDNAVYVSLATQESGLMLNGHPLTGLPTTSAALLVGDQGASRTLVATSALEEAEIETDYTVEGFRRLQIRILPDRS